MKITVPQYPDTSVQVSGEDPVEILEWETNEYDVLAPLGPVKWNVRAQVLDSELLVKGNVSALFSGLCCRCGKTMQLEISDDFCEMVKITESDEVDLTLELRDAILLALPSHPVCSVDCSGVCPKCGKPLDAESCNCSDNKANDAWNALDNIF